MVSVGRIIARVLLILLALFLGAPSLLWLMYGGFGVYKIIPIVVLGLIVLGLIKVFSSGELKKDYKGQKPKEPMKVQSIFYLVGVIFIFASVWYFAREYIAQFPNSIKLILLIVSTVIVFVIAEFMRGADK